MTKDLRSATVPRKLQVKKPQVNMDDKIRWFLAISIIVGLIAHGDTLNATIIVLVFSYYFTRTKE